MTDDRTTSARNSGLMILQLAISAALIAAIGGLIYIANVNRQANPAVPAHAVMTGKLQVSYMLITSKTATSEDASGSTIDATRVEYFSAYVLVTTESGATVLWAIDRLKKFEVVRVESDTIRKSK